MTDITWTNVTASLANLQPWEHNPKTSTKKQAGQLARSFDELGQFQTIAIGPAGEVYDGHQRLTALLAAHGPGYQVEARQASRPLTEQERRKIAIYSRQIGAWDWDILSAWEPAELMGWGFDVDLLSDWRRDVAALGDFLDSEKEQEPSDAEPQTNRAEELREEWGVEPGQMWRLPSRTDGQEHRLICGDCTDAAVVELVMAGERAAITFTSPPYNLGKNIEISNRSQSMKDKGSVYDGNEDDLEQDDYLGLLCLFTEIAFSVSDYALVNVQQLAGNKVAILDYLHAFREHFADVAIWHKTNQQPAMAQSVMNSTFEYIFFLASKKNPTRAIDTATYRGTFDNVYTSTINTNKYADIHGAAFPVEFAEHFISVFCNGVCFEPFNGTGTTLIACENLARQCRAVEISPGYVAVALQRYLDAFGIRAELVS